MGSKCTHTPHQEDTHGHISTWRATQHHWQRKMQIKPQDSVVYLSERPWFLGPDSSKCWWAHGTTRTFSLPTGMQNHTGFSKTSWAVFCKLKHNHHTTQQFHSWASPPREMKILCAHKNLYTDVYSSFHPNSPKLKPPPPHPAMSTGLWADKQRCSSAWEHSLAMNTEDLPPRPFEWIASALCQVTEARLLGLRLCAPIHRTLQKWQN